MRLWVKGSMAALVSVLSAAAFIVPFEGLETEPYLDAVGIPTNCGGNTQNVDMTKTMTHEECMALLVEDTKLAQDCVITNSVVPMTENEVKAYTSFVFNVGCGNFKSSTLLKKLNAGDHEGACDELPRWIYAKGKKLNGLVRRRAKEREVCLAR